MHQGRPDRLGCAQLTDLDDIELIGLTRAGSAEAFAELYERYAHGAIRLARHLGQRDPEDVAAEAFASTFDALTRGKGPRESFRSYLYVALRHEAARRGRLEKRVRPTDDVTQIDTAVDLDQGGLDGFERTAVRGAYESLPDRWRTVLWHLDVQGHRPHEVAESMGLSPNGVSALVYRARSGLREAYLRQHLRLEPDSDSVHEAVRETFPAVLRRTAPERVQVRTHAHLASCVECMRVYLELADVAQHVA